MSVNYNKLWKLLIDKNLNRTELKEKVGISFNVLARMGKNEPVSLESLEKICSFLKCNIGEIVDFSDNDESSKKQLNSIELFAGAGGLALGIEKAGFNSLGLIEIDKDASETLRQNRPKWRVINDDIANISYAGSIDRT